MSVFEMYRQIKFAADDSGEELKLYPREQITWQDLVAYNSLTGQNVSKFEVDLIMGLDAIFEGREND